ncbi:MAG: TetR/AcrR family transcriptional regulator [Hydrogenophilaceae bacterium]|nr:TetR/AcrR family transcriptional regulator [Hydrogenophilaceae bacterium]
MAISTDPIAISRRSREKGQQQKAILDAARELFAEAGETAVTLRAVAERIGYSTTVIYQHFSDKQSLIQALCDHDFLQMAKDFASLADIAHPGQRLHALGLGYVSFALQHPNAFRFLFLTDRAALPPENSAIPKGNIALDTYALLKHTIAECIQQGLLRSELKDVEQMSQLCWANVHGIACMHLYSSVHQLWVDWRPAMENAEKSLEIFERGISRDGKPFSRAVKNRKGK